MHKELISSEYAQYLPKLNLTGLNTSSSTDQDLDTPLDSPTTPRLSLTWGSRRPWSVSSSRTSIFLPESRDDSAV